MTPASTPIALVTGAGRGIGRAAALALAKDGAHVYINYLTAETQSQETLAEIEALGGSASLLHFDVTSGDDTAQAVKTIVKEAGTIDILVNNAGIREDRLLAMMKAEAWQRVLETNLTGFYNLTKPVVKAMLKKRYGRIVNVTSTAGILGNAGQVNYSAAKAGLIGATKALAREVANRGITVNAVAPGFIETRMVEGMDPDRVVQTIPAGRMGTPEEVAFAIAFLSSPGAAYITGQVIGINGGMV